MIIDCNKELDCGITEFKGNLTKKSFKCNDNSTDCGSKCGYLCDKRNKDCGQNPPEDKLKFICKLAKLRNKYKNKF